jgi:hypothetical protein
MAHATSRWQEGLGLGQVRPGVLTGECVHGFVDELGVAGVPAVLLDQVRLGPS